MVIHGLPQWKIEVGNSRLQFVPMNAEFDFKNELIFLKVLIVQKVKDVFVDCGRRATLSHISCSSSLAALLLFPCSSSTIQYQKVEDVKVEDVFVTIITVAFFARWTCSIISMHLCVW